MKLIELFTSSLRTKLLVMFIILTSIPLLAVGVASYQRSFQSVSKHNKATTLLAADQLARNIDILFEDTERLLELGRSPQVQSFLNSQSEKYADAKQILQNVELYRDTYQNKDLLNISIVNLYGKGISQRRGVFQMNYNPMRNLHFVYLTQYPDVVLKIPPASASKLDRLDGFEYPEQNVISIIATVKQRITHEVIGYIVIDLKDSFIEAFCKEATIGKTGYFEVLDQNGSPVLVNSKLDKGISKEQLSDQRNSFIQQTSGSPLFIAFTTSSQTGWKIVGTAPLQEIIAEANDIRKLIVVSVSLSVLFTLILYFFLTQRIILPIRVLMRKMRKAAHGTLDAKVKLVGRDEISDLGNSFNLMLDNIKELMETSIREREEIQKAELRILQAQINPHFLYNTLDSILWMAEAENKENVIALVKALSRFFRLSLNKGKDWVSIKKELEHAESYLTIQQMRYRDILEYEITVPQELQVYPILKMTLQPLVENAIYHGIKNKRGKGKLHIYGYFEKEDIVLVVDDNGIGMSPEKLASLRERMKSPVGTADTGDETQGGYGLQNVHHRIRLFFGPEYGVELRSVEGQSSQVSVRLPKR